MSSVDYDSTLNDARTNAEQSETGVDFRVNHESRPLVYFVGGEAGPIKIGFTQQPIKERLKCIQNGSPINLHVLATLPAPRLKEKWYHHLFARVRLHGEWFERHPLLLREIAWLNGVPGVNPVTGCDGDWAVSGESALPPQPPNLPSDKRTRTGRGVVQ